MDRRKNIRRRNAKRATSPVFEAGLPRALDMRITSLTRNKVSAEMRISEKHMNRSGRVNGGAIMAFADVTGAAGAVANLPPGHRSGTIESKTNFFTAARGPALSAVSIPLHIGRTTTVWQTTVKNADGQVVAIVTQTQIVIPANGASEDRSAGTGLRRKAATSRRRRSTGA